MILSDRSIREYVETGYIGVSPEPQDEQFQPASFDIRLGEDLIHPSSSSKFTDRQEHELKPGEAYIGHTKDYIELPKNIAAQLAGRSSVGRRGVIIHKTAGWIDPGFEGEITLELYNFSNNVQTFEVGERVGQLVFFKTDKPSQGYDGQYQGQEGPTL